MTARTKSAPRHIDYGLLILIAILIGFGIVMQFSSSYAVKPHEPFYYITRHLIWLTIGSVGAFIAYLIDYRTWRTLAIPIMAVALMLLVAVLIFGEEGDLGAKRHLFRGSVQPSELAKLAVVIYIAAWLASKGKKVSEVIVGLIPFAIILGTVIALILQEPDVSTSALIAMTALAMLIVAGADLLQITTLLLVVSVIFTFAIAQFQHARGRVLQFIGSFMAPWESSNLQIRAGYMALRSGGLFGKGLANSTMKLGNLPVVQSDLVFAIVSEELGLLGAMSVIALFLLLGYKGTRIALRVEDPFGRLLAFGITTWIVLQAFINMAVVTVTIPNTGMPLPFFSYGGTSTVITLTALGILLNISKGGGGRFRLDANSLFRRRNRRSRVSRAHRRSRA
jgi:cell division protein FtsW